jgi:hypothetical protein
MNRIYTTGRMWPIRGASDLVGAARRAEGIARSLGWPAKDADALSRMVLELGGNALERVGGGTLRLEAGATVAEVIVEDLNGDRARANLAVTTTPMPNSILSAAG